MAKVVLICPRNPQKRPYGPEVIGRLSAHLSPDIITPHPPAVMECAGAVVGLLNPMAVEPVKHASVCLGTMLAPKDDWWQPGADAPDGSYSLFRVDADSVEVLTDTVATRHVWYVQTQDLFVASSSQRAIVCLLGDFEPDRRPFPWMFSSGTQGPRLSWDRRIRQLPADGRARLDRTSWTLTTRNEPAVFKPVARSVEEHERVLEQAMDGTFRHFYVDCSKWVLPLSGGADSRAMSLFMLRNGLRPRCVTWGIAESMGQKDNDATVARALAEQLHLEHRYLTTDVSSEEPAETILDRFLRASEGGTDLIEPYMDGFRLWKGFFDEGTVGQIRGDEVFGHRGAATPLDMRAQCWGQLLTDFPNLEPLTRLGLEQQVFPEDLRRQPGESLSTWKDRFFQTYTEPGVLAAMNELMCNYIEIVNPLAARDIVLAIRTIPDYWRDYKRAYRRLILSVGPNLGWAKHVALAKTIDLMTSPFMVDPFRSTLDTRPARDLLSDELIDLILRNLVVAEPGAAPSRVGAAQKLARGLIPRTIRKWLRSAVWKAGLSWNVVAHRAYMICRMNALLREDAALFRQSAG